MGQGASFSTARTSVAAVVHLSSCERRHVAPSHAQRKRDLQHRHKSCHQVSYGLGCRINCNRLSGSNTLHTDISLLLHVSKLGQSSLALYAHDVAQRPDDAHARAAVERVNGGAAEQCRAPAASFRATAQFELRRRVTCRLRRGRAQRQQSIPACRRSVSCCSCGGGPQRPGSAAAAVPSPAAALATASEYKRYAVEGEDIETVPRAHEQALRPLWPAPAEYSHE